MRNISVVIILNLDQWFRTLEMSFEDISYLELWQPLFRQSKPICPNLVQGIMWDISVKLF